MFKKAIILSVCLSAWLAVFSLEGLAQEGRAADEDAALQVWDPIEPVNRGIFWFNDKADIYVLEPVARGYDYIVPAPMQDCIGNFFNNLRYPAYLVSDLVQLKFTQAAEHTGRFLLNTVVGMAGLVDVASHWGLKEHEEDFGTALAYHGVPPGPYLVLPFLGPSNLRDGFGRLVDGFLHPLYYTGSVGASERQALAIGVGSRALDLIDQRANMFEAIKAAKESALDYYLFVQSAFYQHRQGLVEDRDTGNLSQEIDFSDAPLP